VIAPVGTGEDGETYNINADTAAGAIAGALNANRLLMLTDVPGVLDAKKNLHLPTSPWPKSRRLIADGTISGGMIPKVLTCIEAVNRASKVPPSWTAAFPMPCCWNCSPRAASAR
jgi:acetylglutamate kinase